MKIKRRKEKKTIAVKTTCAISGLPQFLAQAYAAVFGYMKENHVLPAGPPYALYNSEDMHALEVEAGIPVFKTGPGSETVHPGSIPAGLYATTRHKGPYSNLKQTYDKLAVFIEKKGYSPAGMSFEIFHKDPDATRPEKLKTDVFFLLKEQA